MLSMLLLCPLIMRNFQFPLLKLLKDPMIFDRVMPHKLMKKMKFFVLTYEQLCMAFAFLVLLTIIIMHAIIVMSFKSLHGTKHFCSSVDSYKETYMQM